MYNRLLFYLLAGAPLAVVACDAPPDLGLDGETEGPDSISPADAPSRVLPGVSARLAFNISRADIGKTFGVDDAHIPYPDTYWPFVDDGIDSRWNGSGTPSPLEKLMSIAAPADTQKAKDWEHKQHGKAVPDVAPWWGHCPGWTGAAMSNAPILHSVNAKSDGHGGIKACTAQESGCVKFEIGDINALEAEIYVDGNSRFGGARCDTKPSDIKRDTFGRIVRNGSGCQGINAGSLLVLLGNRMKSQHKAMAIDAQSDFNTDQIWNQPAYRYTVYAYETLTEAEAANLVAHGTKTGDQRRYLWNGRAKGFVRVDIGLKWVSEQGPNLSVTSGADSTRETRFVAVIELDNNSTRPTTNVIGGEYLDDPSVGADRLTVPPFVWIAVDAGPERLPATATGSQHNPYVKPSLVKKLIALGTTRG